MQNFGREMMATSGVQRQPVLNAPAAVQPSAHVTAPGVTIAPVRTEDVTCDKYTARTLREFKGSVPVRDIFQFSGSRFTILLKTLIRSAVVFIFSTQPVFSLLWLAIFGIAIIVVRITVALRLYLKIITEDPFDGFSLSKFVQKFPQTFWEYVGTKIALKFKHQIVVFFWWFVYLLVSDISDFEHNFCTAWSEKAAGCSIDLHLFTDKMTILAPIRLENAEPIDEDLIKQIKMFYRLLKTKRGLPELIIPKRLQQIDIVDIKEGFAILGQHTETINMGHTARAAVALFHSLKANTEQEFKKELNGLGENKGLEFVRVLNRSAVTGVIITPAVASLLFAIIWMSVFLRKNSDGAITQAIVGTAFTVASYLVTAGSLVVALVAYLDAKEGDVEGSVQSRPIIEITATRGIQSGQRSTASAQQDAVIRGEQTQGKLWSEETVTPSQRLEATEPQRLEPLAPVEESLN